MITEQEKKKTRFNRGYRGTYKGRYPIRNPMKYRGDWKNIVYSSSWELKFMIYCDKNPSVLEWSSEECIIPYISPKDGQYHRYFVDFWIKVKTTTGTKEFLIEVKPKAQTKPPKKKSKVTQKYLNECLTYEVNQAKWTAAEAYCIKKNMGFLIFTEDELG